MKRLKIDFNTGLAIAIFVFLALAPLFLPMFRLTTLSKFMCFAIVAVGLDMIWGYTGILSLGHGVYFGLGAYCMAMYLSLQASGGEVPNTMQVSGTRELPAFWVPFNHGWFALAAVILVPVLVALVIGYLTFLNRIRGVYFSIISQALALIVATLLTGMPQYTGGSTGLTNFSTVFGFDLSSNLTKLGLFYITFALLLIVFLVCRYLVSHRIGKVFIAIRDGENRARFTGYNVAVYKVFVYCLSAAIAGIGGALFVTQVGIITPAEVGVAFSIEMVMWVAIGGKGTLVGAILGALVVNGLKTGISEQFPSAWSYFMALAFIVVILWLPKGIISLKDQISSSIKKQKGSDIADEDAIERSAE